ncbi:MAG: class D beta-lactamase [Candidatus Adiutrix sp.]|jgi:beta-lactamase class D|nr:class D beta-lactamase [Candidatus Adiutrix sp.]
MRHKFFIIFCAVSLLLLQAFPLQKLQAEPAADTSNPILSTTETTMPQAQTQTPAPKEMSAPLSELISAEDLAAYFDEYPNAVMLLSDGVSQIVFNEPFSTQRLSPYSTFKICNSLIALEEGVVSIDDSQRRWDGTEYNRRELMQDQDMASAIKYSAVWYYQQLAIEVGETAMQTRLNAVGYGNMDISGGIDKFWLYSSLLISSQEQLDFIIRLYRNELPFSRDNMEYVKSILRQDAYPIEIYGKTGSSGDGNGWFVGYTLLNEKPYFFAVYIEGTDASGALARDKIAEILSKF